MKLSLALLLILLLTAISISNNQDSAVDDVAPEENQYLLHVESSERLLKIMQQISPIAGEKNIDGTKSLAEADMTDLIEAVEELLFYAELMSIKIPATELDESKTVIFSAMASKLYDEALNVQQLTKNYDLDSTDYSQKQILDDAFTRLSQTCIACHQLFRDN
jgi:hypothetical protein